jgi:hypothetical protein
MTEPTHSRSFSNLTLVDLVRQDLEYFDFWSYLYDEPKYFRLEVLFLNPLNAIYRCSPKELEKDGIACRGISSKTCSA